MSETTVIRVRNVNEALRRLKDADPENDPVSWRRVAPRGLETIEHKGMVVTEYAQPTERVLFSAARDANPFFHFFESLWILAGRRDVEFLAQFNPKMREYSDDGVTYHAPYGWRLRHHFRRDQLIETIDLLRADPITRQAVLSIWDPDKDLLAQTKDMPCNDMIFFKQRDKTLDITIACRSNDAIWGAYGANVVQFSMIQEFVAGAIGAKVGVYRQNSDSFHIYVGNEAWERVKNSPDLVDYYESPLFETVPYSIWTGGIKNEKGHYSYRDWLQQLAVFFDYADAPLSYPNSVTFASGFFADVVMPMYRAWRTYRFNTSTDKNAKIEAAQGLLYRHCAAADWRRAAIDWLGRRRAA